MIYFVMLEAQMLYDKEGVSLEEERRSGFAVRGIRRRVFSPVGRITLPRA